jgi:bacillolysin
VNPKKEKLMSPVMTLREKVDQLRKVDPRLLFEQDAEKFVLQGKLSSPVDPNKVRRTPHDIARGFLTEHKELLGRTDANDLINGRAQTDHLNMTHVALEQKYGEARVLGGMLSVHFREDGTVYLVKSDLANDIDVPKRPKTTAQEAQQIALGHAGTDATLVAGRAAELMVVPARVVHQEKSGQRFFLCWRVDVDQSTPKQPSNWVYFIDTEQGKVLFRYDSLIAGTATGYYSTGTQFNSKKSGSVYVTDDETTSSSWTTAQKPHVHTYDAAGAASGTTTTFRTDTDDIWGEEHLPPRESDERFVVDAHRFVGYALAYYYNTHGLNSWDGAGADIQAVCHYGTKTNNAYWSSFYQKILIGDGDGQKYDSFASIDVLGHEFTHGVNNGFNVVQVYDGETGALNEAIADCFSSFIALDYPAEDSQPWCNGERICLSVHPRNLADPSRDAQGTVRYDATNDTTKLNSVLAGYYPDYYSLRYQGTSDYNGVHCNCPIIGHAVYLMVHGGTHRFSGINVPAIGIAPVEQMLFYTISTPGLLSNTSQFSDFRAAMLQACLALYPDNLDFLVTVKAAFRAVGIGPDLYVRDSVVDLGEEPGVVSCMSPDIINRKSQADAGTLAMISDLNNATLCEKIERGQDNFVYFRVFNRGSSAISGTFRLFISTASSFPTPANWKEVGSYIFPMVAPGATWVPTAANQCITFPKQLIATLGMGHFCFIGMIECAQDPAPDRMQIHDINDFYQFIAKSNNYGWRNCDIEDVLPNLPNGQFAVIHKQFTMTGFGRGVQPFDLEVDTRNLPVGTLLQVLMPKSKARAVKLFDVQNRHARLGPRLTTIPVAIPVSEQRVTSKPIGKLVVKPEEILVPTDTRALELAKLTAITVRLAGITKLAGVELANTEELPIDVTLKFPANVGARDTYLSFRQVWQGKYLGQMNYLFRIR